LEVPLVAAVLRAVSRGLLDLRSYEDSPRWWAGFTLKLRMARFGVLAEKSRLEAQCESSLIPLSKGSFGRAERAEKLRNAVSRFEEALSFRESEALQEGDELDLLAKWYIINAPDRLRKLGVDFGSLVSDR